MHPRIRELLEYLDVQRALLTAAFDAVPAGARDRRPAPGEWSAAGVIEHLAIVEQRVAGFTSTLIAAAKTDGVEIPQNAAWSNFKLSWTAATIAASSPGSFARTRLDRLKYQRRRTLHEERSTWR